MLLANNNNIILGYINTNSTRNEIELLKPIMSHSVAVNDIAETKIEDTFPISQFMMEDYMRPFRHDQKKCGGRLLVNVKEGPPAK